MTGGTSPSRNTGRRPSYLPPLSVAVPITIFSLAAIPLPLATGHTLALSRSLTGKGIAKQSFAIYGKVAEVRRVMTPALQRRVVEVHPEVSFWALAGERPMTHHKGKAEGYEERRALLAGSGWRSCTSGRNALARTSKWPQIAN